VRAAAVLALGDRPPKEALPKLKKILNEKQSIGSVLAALNAIAAIGTREARVVLAEFLEGVLRDGDRYVYHALSSFEKATGQRWIEAGAHPTAYYQARAKSALAWWKKQEKSP
jgi:hypothetical protein